MKFNYRAACENDLPALKRLWLTVFDEAEKAVELFFERNIDILHSYLAESGGEVAAAVHLLDCTLNGSRSNYLCGAATLPEFRNHGIMTALIQTALDDARARGDTYSVLLPAQPWLYGYYARFGYEPRGAAGLFTLSRADMESPVPPVPGNPDLRELQKCLGKDSLVYSDSFIEFAADYYACYGCKTLKSRGAFAIIEEHGCEATVIYSIYNDIEELYSLLLNGSTAGKFTLSRPADGSGHGMICALAKNPLPDTFFAGITLE